MNKLTKEKQVQVIQALVEGNSISSTVRMTGVAKTTILRLLEAVGTACEAYQKEVMKSLPCRTIQCDEIWSFCYAKEKNVPKEMAGQVGVGDVWTWTAICADTKLVPCWLVGERTPECAVEFMKDLAGRLFHRVQLTTDGFRPYFRAVDNAFGENIDFAIIKKLYGNQGLNTSPNVRYSAAVCTGAIKGKVKGSPKQELISTSYVERQNLTMRMGMRRFTRLTNAFSKKIDNLKASVALHFMHYNFCRVHKTLRVTPAMEAGLTGHIWTIDEIVDLTNRMVEKGLKAS